MDYKQLSTAEFKSNKMKCPYLSNDRCMIYSVRPLVCRLQGHIPELRCVHNKKTSISAQLLQEIKKEFNSLVAEVGGINLFYSTRKIEKSQED